MSSMYIDAQTKTFAAQDNNKCGCTCSAVVAAAAIDISIQDTIDIREPSKQICGH